MDSFALRRAAAGVADLPYENLDPGDIARVTEKNGRLVQYRIEVYNVLDHGHYRTIIGWDAEGQSRQFELWPQRQSEGEVLAVEVLYRQPRRQPFPDDLPDVPLFRPLVPPQRCPECGALCRAILPQGWPCYECRMAAVA